MPVLFGKEVSDDVYAANQHLLTAPKEEKTPAREDLEREIREQFARSFEAQWRLLGGPLLEKEHSFDDNRKWSADYLHRPTKTLIELEGGVYSRGRHLRSGGFINDCFKYNAAQMAGYGLIRIATGMDTAHYLSEIIEHLERLTNASNHGNVAGHRGAAHSN